MSWITEVFIGIRCDRCHEIFEGSDDCSFFCDKESAAEYASEDGWLLENGHHYCPMLPMKEERAFKIAVPIGRTAL